MKEQKRSGMAKLQSRLFLAAMTVPALALIYLAFGWVGILIVAAGIYIVGTMVVGYQFASYIYVGSIVVGAPVAFLLGFPKGYIEAVFSWQSYLRIAGITIAAPVLFPFTIVYFGVQELRRKDNN